MSALTYYTPEFAAGQLFAENTTAAQYGWANQPADPDVFNGLYNRIYSRMLAVKTGGQANSQIDEVTL